MLYESVLARDPNDTGVAGRYGLALGLAGRPVEARIQLDRALHLRGLRLSGVDDHQFSLFHDQVDRANGSRQWTLYRALAPW